MAYLEYLQTLHGVLSFLLGVLVAIVILMPRKFRIMLGLPIILLGFAYMMHLGILSQSLPIKEFPINETKTYEYNHHKLVIENKKKWFVVWFTTSNAREQLFYFPYDMKLAAQLKKAAQNKKRGIRGKIEMRIEFNKGNSDMQFKVKYIPIKVPEDVLRKGAQ